MRYSRVEIMKKHYIKTTIIGLSLILAGLKPAGAQQNIQFTQYMFNALSVNPAYAGYKEDWFGQMALRTQWTGLNGAPNTGQVSIDGVVDPVTKRMGVGLQLTGDKLGAQSSASAYANFAYRLRLNAEDTQRLSFGLALGVTNYSLDGTKLNPVDVNDPNLPTGQINSYIPDARFGVYYYNENFYVGASVMDLLSGDKSNSIFKWDAGTTENLKRKRHMYIIAGMLNNLSDEVRLRPSILIKEDFKGPTSLDLSAMFIFNDRVWLGGSYRTGLNLWNKAYSQNISLSNVNSVSGVVQFNVSSRFRLGYSYDYMLNKLSSVQSGSHELTLGITFNRSLNRLLSPRFF
ncbi:type IX secretion system membrane protein PorP/SprF [Pedobacter sp. KR3-3]|uniref:Type IX secretion system membrane protein PorP/SprF n=1 Tax=Pedobacter albus TaxID=3113905 RepID=A0ABU7I673_9SPHI|nr:type IX secretion system membrane protein PorP/SprF [Pedobacter sp. KR3-3]MEE1944857.1 type IX secretion system membrane protein PorP/SprF [Pedobacter sp. KR3-3]